MHLVYWQSLHELRNHRFLKLPLRDMFLIPQCLSQYFELDHELKVIVQLFVMQCCESHGCVWMEKRHYPPVQREKWNVGSEKSGEPFPVQMKPIDSKTKKIASRFFPFSRDKQTDTHSLLKSLTSCFHPASPGNICISTRPRSICVAGICIQYWSYIRHCAVSWN